MGRIIEFKDDSYVVKNDSELLLANPPAKQAAFIASLERIARNLSREDIRNLIIRVENAKKP